MDEEFIADLKQFMTAFLRQEFADVARKSDLENLATKDDLAQLDRKLDDTKTEILGAIGDAMEANTAATDEQIADVRRQLAALKTKAA